MRSLYLVFGMLAVILAVLFFHVRGVNRLRDEASAVLDIAEGCAKSEDWEGTRQNLEKVNKIWENSAFWLSVTLPAVEVEALELSLRRLNRFAEMEEKADFFGEFTNTRSILDYIPAHEGFNWKMLL